MLFSVGMCPGGLDRMGASVPSVDISSYLPLVYEHLIRLNANLVINNNSVAPEARPATLSDALTKNCLFSNTRGKTTCCVRLSRDGIYISNVARL